MLRHLASVLLVALLAVGAVVAPPAVAPASACEASGSSEDGWGQVEGSCPGGSENDDTDGPSGGGGPRVCIYSSTEIPCTTDDGYFNSTYGCYVKRLEPQPAKTEDIWNGEDQGLIILCTPPQDLCFEDIEGFGSYLCRPGPMHVDEMPPAAGVSPLQLAQELAARMKMSMGDIGSTPRSNEIATDSVGLVGVPVWLWVTNPGPGTTEDIEASDSEGGVTVTVRGALDRIEWTLADEGGVFRSVTCTGDDVAGTVWTEANSDGGRASSPTCGFDGFDNSRSGRVTLTGTAYWNLEWEGAGQSGELPVDPQSESSTLTMGEVQVVTQ